MFLQYLLDFILSILYFPFRLLSVDVSCEVTVQDKRNILNRCNLCGIEEYPLSEWGCDSTVMTFCHSCESERQRECQERFLNYLKN